MAERVIASNSNSGVSDHRIVGSNSSRDTIAFVFRMAGHAGWGEL